MNSIFLIDKNIISYQDLINYVNGYSLKFEFSENEKIILDKVKELSGSNIQDFDDLINSIKVNNSIIELRTSGTTGKSKNIIHNVESITKNVIIDHKYSSVVWGLSYQIEKMAFYQVFFQSLFNKSTLVNLFGYNFDEIKNRIILNNITHLSATPTFYKILLSDNHLFDKVVQITLGGERSDERLLEKIKFNFPNAKISNVYASTESASLFSSEGCVFRIPHKYTEKIKIIDNTLYIHRDLLGTLNEDIDDWYNTQDEVELINDFEFKFIGRKNLEINVSGVKVNPFKIESVLNSLDFVSNSFVYSKKNSVVGNILCCDIVVNEDISKSKLKNDLKQLLNKYEIPSIINIVESLSINENFKISRL